MPAPTANLRTVDWFNARYPVTCFDGKATLVKMVHGDGHAHGYDVTVSKPFYGTLGGRHAALVRQSCTGAGSSPDAILAFVDGGPAPQFIGYLLTTDENSYVKDVTFQGGGVSITSYAVSPQGSMASPDLLVTSRWTVDTHMKPTERLHDVEPNPDNPDAQQAAQAFACSELDQVEAAIRTNNALKTELSGGSVEGVPTWSESQFIGNISQISAVNWHLLRLRQAQTELRQACQTGSVSAD